MDPICTRFPPSPTGTLHVGGARTALFNWLYARHSQGRFVLRIEDTDAKRSTSESVDAIFEALEWLGIDWDEGPYYQSQRTDIYTDHIQQLLDSGNAYYCTCSKERLDDIRKKAMAVGDKPKYDGACRNKGLNNTDGAVVRFKAPLSGETVLQDIVKGRIVFQNEELDDFVIARSDGSPTYNFVVVVDDMTMGINTIIRGDDHVMNTPKQILLYEAFEARLPIFAHVPMVLGSDRTRLSKRHGATAVTAYRDMGVLPDAFVNYLVRLGWSYGDQEFFTRQELITKFTLENLGRSAGVFDQDKLMAINADHIQALAPEHLVDALAPFLAEYGYDVHRLANIQKVIQTLQPRSKTLREMAEMSLFYFQEQIAYDEKVAKKFLKPSAIKPLRILSAELDKIDAFNEAELEAAFKSVMAQTDLKLGKIAQPVRVALTGRTASPGIFEITEIIGKKQVQARLKAAIDYIESISS